MKKMKTYGKAPLSFGHLHQGERKDVCLQSRQGSRKQEARSITGTPVSDFLFLIIYFLFPEKENNEYRITLPGLLTGNVESGRNITVRCTSRYHALSGATNINGALHLGFQTADTAISGIAAEPQNTLSGNRRVCRTAINETAAAPRNICRTAGHPSGKMVQRTETLTGNMECKIRKTEDGRRKLEEEKSCFLTCNSNFPAPLSPFIKGDESRVLGTEGVRNPKTKTLKENKEYRIRKSEVGSRKTEVRIRNLTSNETSMSFLSPIRHLADGWGEAKYKAAPHLPRGRFYSGDCPGAAAITIIISLFSSLRVSPNFAGFAQTNLPVPDSYRDNQQALHRSSFVPLVKGDKSRFIGTGGKWDEIRFSESGGIDDKTPNPRVQEVSTTSPKIRMKGFKPERRYAYVLN